MYVPIEWTAKVFPLKLHELAISFDIYEALAQVTQLIKCNGIVSSLPETLHENKGEQSSQPIWILHN